MAGESRMYESSNYRCFVYHMKQTEDIFMTSCGYEHCTPGYVFSTKKRSGYHLHVILSGKGRLRVNGREQALHFGQMFLTKPGEETSYGPDPDDPWHYCWMTFDGNNARAYCEAAGFSDGVNVQDCQVEYERFYELVQRILAQPELTFANDVLRTGVLLEYISLAISSFCSAKKSSGVKSVYTPEIYAQHAKDFIESNFQSVHINDVVRYIGIHRSYLTSIFCKKYGVSPQKYLMQYKLKRGSQMLLETELPIQEIAKAIGYDNPSTFSKMFKATYGIGPRTFRKNNGVPEASPVE